MAMDNNRSVLCLLLDVSLPTVSTLLLHPTTLCQEEGITNSAIWCPIKWTSKLATSST